jgi:hypothetical protein
VIYFFDNCLSYRYAAMLRALDVEAKALREEFEESAPDEEWIPVVGQRGWVLLTGDRNIRWKPHQREILEKAKVTTFFMVKGYDNLGRWEQAAHFLKAWPNIMQMAEKKQIGRCYLVQMNGKAEPF